MVVVVAGLVKSDPISGCLGAPVLYYFLAPPENRLVFENVSSPAVFLA